MKSLVWTLLDAFMHLHTEGRVCILLPVINISGIVYTAHLVEIWLSSCADLSLLPTLSDLPHPSRSSSFCKKALQGPVSLSCFCF